MAQLRDGDAFPTFSGESLQNGTITLPDDIPHGNYCIINVYRAEW